MVFDTDIKAVAKLTGEALKTALREAKAADLQVADIDISFDMDAGCSPSISLRVLRNSKGR